MEMNYRRLGRTGLEISPLCVGCMSFGVPTEGDHSWTLGEEQSRTIIRRALEAGLNFFDTANVYSAGSSEEIVGRALKDFARREDVVIATKVHGRMRPGPNGAGLSRRHIMEQIDASLRRLGTDHVDLYVVRAGKARYIGASSMFAWQFMKALSLQEQHGWSRFVSMQNHLNLLYREEEREMIPLCIDQGIGLLPWSPMARGRLARPAGEQTARDRSDRVTARMYAQSDEADRPIIDAVGRVAERLGAERSQIALAWVRQKEPVSAPIFGATSEAQLTSALASLAIVLSPEDLAELEAPYRPKPVAGHG
jgi:aryl-alcohol dehydrogenase-like predicted oxidoreductase